MVQYRVCVSLLLPLVFYKLVASTPLVASCVLEFRFVRSRKEREGKKEVFLPPNKIEIVHCSSFFLQKNTRKPFFFFMLGDSL
jgi:hypothetical protein